MDDAPEVYRKASPIYRITPDAPPALIVHGDLDTLAPVEQARAFVDKLRATSRNPVVYVELRGAHHAFEVFNSIRTMHAIAGVDLFLAWLVKAGPGGPSRPAASPSRSTAAAARRRPIRHPRRVRSHDERREADQHLVVVHAPTREVAPRLVAIGVHRDPRLDEHAADLVELVAGDTDRIVGRGRVVVVETEEPGDLAQREIPRADAQWRLRRRGNIDERQADRGRVEHGAGGGDPGAMRVRRPEEHRAIRTRCGSPAPR